MVMGCDAYYITQANLRLVSDNLSTALIYPKAGSPSSLITMLLIAFILVSMRGMFPSTLRLLVLSLTFL